jgi:type III pantothenate kinase
MTIDVIDRSGQHLGGQIIPGIHLMGESLRSKTSDIAAATKKSRDPGDGLGIFGKNTDDAIAYGTLTAACGAIERAAKRVRSAGMRPKIVLTGGDASRILKQLNSNAIHRPHLVLQGLATMLQSEK